ncbi:MAG: RHS repeat-associated core domain-containing protein, partial [Thermosynechococcaceae cyanobacterium]
WDYRNRLTQVLFKNATGTITKQVNFIYDALNRRIEKKVDPDGSGPNPATTERFAYDRDHIKLVFNGNNTLQRRYQHGPVIDHVVADENSSSGQVFWALSDHQGTVRDWVTSTGTVQKHIRYNSFGRITNQSGTLNNRFWYTGREWDSEIGLYYYRARYYDPLVGRFIGEDPIGFGAKDVNFYRYVLNSPVQGTDPMGLFLVTPPPVATPWYVPLLRRIPLTAPLVIPGVLLNPQRTNPYEYPHQLPKKQNSCPDPECPDPEIERKKGVNLFSKNKEDLIQLLRLVHTIVRDMVH